MSLSPGVCWVLCAAGVRPAAVEVGEARLRRGLRRGVRLPLVRAHASRGKPLLSHRFLGATDGAREGSVAAGSTVCGGCPRVYPVSVRAVPAHGWLSCTSVPSAGSGFVPST